VLQDTCPGLVAQIENGELTTPETRAILLNALRPMLAKGIDTVVLGCTHYPFVIPLIEQISGEDVRVIDPAPAVARQVGRRLEAQGMRNPGSESVEARYFTSGPISPFAQLLARLLGEGGPVHQVEWVDDRQLMIASSQE
jgi:glutamate racemase